MQMESEAWFVNWASNGFNFANTLETGLNGLPLKTWQEA